MRTKCGQRLEALWSTSAEACQSLARSMEQSVRAGGTAGDTETLPEGTAAPVNFGGMRLTEAGGPAAGGESAADAMRAASPTSSPTASPARSMQVPHPNCRVVDLPASCRLC